jgi:hypothetical protein
MNEIGRWFFRVVEDADGGWTCRWGRTELDSHPTLDEAAAHIAAIAAAQRPSQVFIHYVDGCVRSDAQFG